MVAYGLAALITAVSLAAPGGIRSVVVGSGGAGMQALPLAMVLVLAPSWFFLIALVVPTWLSPAILAIILAASVWLHELASGLRAIELAGVGVQALTYRLLQKHHKKRRAGAA
ncbi:MAG: hypothetical protein M0Z36_07345 [Thermaerobacter sp.]|nr:hypothetical protein [Thermaerobacter sp.]